ncbi:MAG: TIGR00725 family protein [Desulfuromonadales bacterium]|uniref:TIGR00725 family protein n=1 Tax=Desulfuromonas sp. KJ2020 TaxID=2919173 RepID=UPI0020A80DC8|nr:TIGR00725 family protein [Desulfuromonas sp. KJ2020]MCP3177756.1 TIGR00725 family protein [Desulfuromonas sp. KJ2020]
MTPIVGVIGAGTVSTAGYEAARRVGQLLAEAGLVLVCGGLGGVMEAACRGCQEKGGISLGILPGASRQDANPYVSFPVVTDMGHARNVIIAHTAQVLIAVEGEYGTLSEIAVALKLGRPVIALGHWQQVEGVLKASSPEQAVRLALDCLADHPSRQGE